MAARPPRDWDRLSGPYRRRLIRAGVTRRQYEAGASVQRARGHRPREHAYTRQRAEIRELLKGLPQQQTLERKLRNVDLPAESVEALALAAWAAVERWQDAGGNEAVDTGAIGEDLADAFDAIYDDYGWPDDERDVETYYHTTGGGD